jgi:hypothetical protein
MHTADFFFFFLGLAASSVPAAGACSIVAASPFASASEISPGTALPPRLPGLLLAFLSFFSLSFWSDGFATSTMTARVSRSFPLRSSTAF